MAVEDFKAKEKGLNVEVVFADHQNKPDVGSQIASKWYDAEGVDVIVDVPTSSVALAVNTITKDKGTGVPGLGRRLIRPDRQGVHAQHHPLDVRHLEPRQRHRRRDREDRRRHLVLPHGRLRLRPRARARHRSGRDQERRQGVGKVRHPFPSADFSSFLLQAQASKAKIIGLANAGADTTNAIKQAAEFGIVKGGQNLAGLLVFLSDVHGLGLEKAQGLIITTTFYWDQNDQTRAWAKRFAAANGGKYPTMVQAGVYVGVLHYLKAVAALKSDDGTQGGRQDEGDADRRSAVRQGNDPRRRRKIHPAYLVEVKKPSESKGRTTTTRFGRPSRRTRLSVPIDREICPLVTKKEDQNGIERRTTPIAPEPLRAFRSRTPYSGSS
jgi:branched-chain amino acid transport system substrate-binding protein